jgi:capsular exopolysaccharide synthesis family protein
VDRESAHGSSKGQWVYVGGADDLDTGTGPSLAPSALGSARPSAPLRSVVGVVRRRYWVVLATAVLAVAVSLLISHRERKEYTASAELLFQTPTFSAGAANTAGATVAALAASALAPSSDPPRQALNNLQVLSSYGVATLTADAIGHGVTAGLVHGEVTLAPAGQSDVVTISARDPSPSQAARIANAYAHQYIVFQRNANTSKLHQTAKVVQSQIAQARAQKNHAQVSNLTSTAQQLQALASLQTGDAEVIQTARTPTAPSSPQTKRDAILALLVGVIAGLALANLAERLDRRFHTVEAVEEFYARPVLGRIPQSRALQQMSWQGRRLGAAEVEAFTLLRTSLRYFHQGESGLRTLMLTSATSGDGKSTIAVFLSAAAARSGTRVLLVECDLRHAGLGPKLGLPQLGGLSDILAGDQTLDAVVQHQPPWGPSDPVTTGPGWFDVVLSGPVPPNPSDLLESPRMLAFLKEAEAKYDLVILDAPPAPIVADALPLMLRVGGVVLVTRLNHTTRDGTQRLIQQLDHLGIRPLGIVVNGDRMRDEYYKGGYYGERVSANGREPGEPVDRPAEGGEESVKTGHFRSLRRRENSSQAPP